MLPGPSVMALVLQPLHFLSFLYHKHLLSGSLPYSGHPPPPFSKASDAHGNTHVLLGITH